MSTGILLGLTMGASDLAEVSGAAHEAEKVRQILGTEAGYGTGRDFQPGEVPWDSGYGARFHAFLHSSDTPAFRAACTVETRRVFHEFLPGFVLTRVDVVAPDDLPGEIALEVSFITPSGSTDQTIVGIG